MRWRDYRGEPGRSHRNSRALAGALSPKPEASFAVLFARSEERSYVFARHPRDVRDGDVLRADRLAIAFVRAAPDPFGVGLRDHRHDAAAAFEPALRQQRKVRDL